MDILVTTPKTRIGEAAQEAEDAKKYGGDTLYFRRFPTYAGPQIAAGDRVFYVEDGYIRGFAVAEKVSGEEDSWTCDTTGREYGPGLYVFMRADSWQWIKPIAYPGFQGFRYMIGGGNPGGPVQVVGNWLDPKPEVGKEEVAA